MASIADDLLLRKGQMYLQHSGLYSLKMPINLLPCVLTYSLKMPIKSLSILLFNCYNIALSRLPMASPPQEIVLTSSPNGPITAYNVSSGSRMALFSGSRSPRKGLAFAGKKLFAASHVSSDSGSGSVHLYNWWSSTAFHQLPVPEPVAPLAASFDGMYLFAGGLSGNIYAFSISSKEIVRSFSAHSKAVTCLEINADGSVLLSGSDDGIIKAFSIYQILDASTNGNDILSPLHQFVGHDASVTAITSSTARFNFIILSCALDCTCKFWSLMDETAIRTVTFPCTLYGVAMNPLEHEFYVAGSNGFVYKGVIKVPARPLIGQAQELVRWDKKHSGAVVAVAIVNGGVNLISASEDGKVWLWNVEIGKVIYVLGVQNEGISELLVTKGFGDYKETDNRMVRSNVNLGRWRFGLSCPINQVIEMEQELDAAEKSRTRAVQALESAFQVYGEVLKNIVKQAQASESGQGFSDEEQSNARPK